MCNLSINYYVFLKNKQLKATSYLRGCFYIACDYNEIFIIWVTLWRKTLSPEEKEHQTTLDKFVDNSDTLINELLESMDNPVDYTNECEDIELTMK